MAFYIIYIKTESVKSRIPYHSFHSIKTKKEPTITFFAVLIMTCMCICHQKVAAIYIECGNCAHKVNN